MYVRAYVSSDPDDCNCTLHAVLSNLSHLLVGDWMRLISLDNLI